MGGRSSSKQGRGVRGGAGSMDIDNVDRVKEEPHLSGAYIRSLVKQLTSSRTKDSIVVEVDGDGIQKNKIRGEMLGDQSQEQPPVQPPQHKKQVRRRLHTSRPYQERLLNMAEARREIVTALKFHRASMKQQEANNQDHQSQPVAQPSLAQEAKSKSRRNSRNYASTATASSSTANAATTTNFSGNYLESYSAFTCPPPMPYYWPVSAVAAPPPPPLIPDNFNLTLPHQPLGLTLNFHDFNNLDASLFHNPLSMYTSSSSSSPSASSSSPTLSVATDEMMAMSDEVAAYSSGGTTMNGGGCLGGGLNHHAMDMEEMRELRSISEQHQMEWNDTLNMMTSARWFKFLKTMEIGAEDEKCAGHEDEDDGYNPFDQVMEFPPWLVNANESCCLQDDHFSEDYLQDPALPCMDIGEIDGMDGEWLA